MKDALGDRMKRQYENRTRFTLPRRTYTIIRCDGKAFHTYTQGANKPFDKYLNAAMVAATVTLCKEAQGIAFGYTQSDEISVLLTDFAAPTTDMWFDGNVQKIASVAASIVTQKFNAVRQWQDVVGPAYFDARVFTIPDAIEVENYFIWRQQDASRNSLSMLAQSQFSHKELQNKNKVDVHDMLWRERNINWDSLPTMQKRGVAVTYTQEKWTIDDEIPVWTQDRKWLQDRIPVTPGMQRELEQV